jgi:hypothetical protein
MPVAGNTPGVQKLAWMPPRGRISLSIAKSEAALRSPVFPVLRSFRCRT